MRGVRDELPFGLLALLLDGHISEDGDGGQDAAGAVADRPAVDLHDGLLAVRPHDPRALADHDVAGAERAHHRPLLFGVRRSVGLVAVDLRGSALDAEHPLRLPVREHDLLGLVDDRYADRILLEHGLEEGSLTVELDASLGHAGLEPDVRGPQVDLRRALLGHIPERPSHLSLAEPDRARLHDPFFAVSAP